jgi:hypothetical protein
MKGSEEKEVSNRISTLILDPKLTEARAVVESAYINKEATIKAAEINFRGARLRGFIGLAVAVISVGSVLGSLAFENEDIKRQLRKVEKQRDMALTDNEQLLKRLDRESRRLEVANAHAAEFKKCSEYVNPLLLYPCLQLARSRVESDISSKPEKLA